jgi:hypothetical protein
MKVYTGELEPAVGFASQGSVLPAKDSRGLPVVSVNVAEVDVEFLRVREASLPRFFAEYQRGGRRGSWELDPSWYYGDEDTPAISKLAEPVYVNRFVLGGKRNERVLTYLPMQDIAELQQPGLYFAVMKKAGAFKDELRHRLLHRQRHRPARARLQGQAVRAHRLAADGDPLANAELRVLDARGEPSSRARPTATATPCWTTRWMPRTCWSRRAARTCRCCRSTSRRWTCPSSRSAAAGRPGSTCSPGPVATSIVPAKPCGSPRCCATTTASRW